MFGLTWSATAARGAAGAPNRRPRLSSRAPRAALCLALALILTLSAFFSSPAVADVFGREDVGRVALVVGNDDYGNVSVPAAAQDAQAMAALLTQYGFKVTFGQNLTRGELLGAMREFAASADEGSLRVFYYSGLALQVARENYLMPVDARPSSPVDAARMGVPLETVFAPSTVVLLDASRRSAIEEDFRGFSAGLALADPAPAALATATGPGRIVPRTNGALSAFTSAVIDAVRAAETDLAEALVIASDRASRATGGQQVPWTAGSVSDILSGLTPDPTLLGRPASGLIPVPTPSPLRLALAPPQVEETPPEPTPAAQQQPAPEPEPAPAPAAQNGAPPDASGNQQPAIAPADAFELAFWETIRDSTEPDDFQAYIESYPTGRFVPLARLRVRQLQRAAAPTPPAPAPQQQQQVARAPEPQPARPPQNAPDPTRELVFARPQSSQVPPRQDRASPQSGAQAGSTFRDCPSCPEMVVVPAGSFQMGSATGGRFEQPVHTVTIAAPFAIGQSEVTFNEWYACVDAGVCDYEPRTRGWGGGDLPVFNISWRDAQDYVRYLSSETGQNYRLPTEAEWEYAARGATNSVYWWGDTVDGGNPNCRDCGAGSRQAIAVKSGPANPFGLFDTAGNVAEWVADCWYPDYRNSRGDGSAREEPRCRERTLRGGSFASAQKAISSTARYKYDADVRYYANGFRVARDL